MGFTMTAKLALPFFCLLALCASAAVSAEGPAGSPEEETASEMQKLGIETVEEEEFLLYDVYGQLSDQDIQDAFQGLAPQYKFKSITGTRYVIVVKKEGLSNKPYVIDIPKADRVRVYPAEHLGDYYRYFGVNSTHDTSVIQLPDEGLMLTEFTAFFEGMTSAEYSEAIANFGRIYGSYNDHAYIRMFHLTSELPFKIFIFVCDRFYSFDRILLKGEGNVVGPYQFRISTFPLVNV